MSSVSVTSSKREVAGSRPLNAGSTGPVGVEILGGGLCPAVDVYRLMMNSQSSIFRVLYSKAHTSDLLQEVESIRALNTTLRSYLDNLRTFRKNLTDMNGNCKQLNKVNMQWVDTLNMMK